MRVPRLGNSLRLGCTSDADDGGSSKGNRASFAHGMFVCKTWSFMHVEDHLRVAARAGAPLRRAPGGAAAPAGGRLWCGARVGSGLRACARAGARRRRPPASNSLRREFEGNSGVPFEGNSKGTRIVLKVLCVVSSKFWRVWFGHSIRNCLINSITCLKRSFAHLEVIVWPKRVAA